MVGTMDDMEAMELSIKAFAAFAGQAVELRVA
jgi:hypothetical protein